MKVRELFEQLQGKEDFDLEFCFYDEQLATFEGTWGLPPLRTFKITSISDIGYSDKVVVLD